MTYRRTPVTGGGSAGSSSGNGLPSTVLTKTAIYTAAVGDFVQADTSTAGFTVTLPSNPAAGSLVAVKKISADANTLTIAPAGSGTIDGDPTATTNTKNAGAVLEHVGSDAWRVAASMTTTGPQGPAGPTGATGSTGSQGPAGTNGAIAQVQDEGSNLTVRGTLNFVGAGVTATDDAANSRTLVTIPGGGGSSGGILAVVDYTPGSSYSVGTSSTMSDVDATNLAITFTAPSSGNVLVRLEALGQGTNNATVNWGLREATTTVGDRQVHFEPSASTFLAVTRKTVTFYITGLTAGSSHTYKWAKRLSFGSSASAVIGGTSEPMSMIVQAA